MSSVDEATEVRDTLHRYSTIIMVQTFEKYIQLHFVKIMIIKLIYLTNNSKILPILSMNE